MKKKSLPYIVKVTYRRRAGDPTPTQGTAVFIAPTFLLTCRHVVGGSDGRTIGGQTFGKGEIEIGWGETGEANRIPATIYRFDLQGSLHPDWDLAVLEVEAPLNSRHTPAWRAPEPHVRLGDTVRAVGYPGGEFCDSTRIVKALDRTGVQTDASFTEGNSGGVLEFSDHREAFCFALVRSEQFVIGHSIGYERIVSYLNKLGLQLPEQSPEGPSPAVWDVAGYKRLLCKTVSKIDLGGLLVNNSAQKVDIERLWVPLMTHGSGADPDRAKKMDHEPRPEAIPLSEAVNRNRVLTVLGEAGSGKSVFLQRLAYALARSDRDRETLHLDCQGLPLCVPLKALEEFIAAKKEVRQDKYPVDWHDIRWIPHYLASRPEAERSHLTYDFFDRQLTSPELDALLLLDGFDEVSPGRRHHLGRLIGAATQLGCRVVISTRPEATPRGNDGESGRLFAEVPQAAILPLDSPSVEQFVTNWTQLVPQSAQDAEKQAERLRSGLRRPGIRRLARNSLMLTAMAVLTSNGQPLPEARAALFKAIVDWLMTQRLKDQPREAGTLRLRLANLGLAMIEQKRANQYLVPLRKAAELICDDFEPEPPRTPTDLAQEYLQDAERTTGLLTRRGEAVQFWHRYLQEFLAAERLAGMSAKRGPVLKTLLRSGTCPEVVKLAGGCMAAMPEDLSALLLDLIKMAQQLPLKGRAYCVGVLGCLIEDLRPTGYPDGREFRRTVRDEWQNLSQSVLVLFEDPREAAKVALADRVAAAEALGQAGDPRLRRDNWVLVPGGVFWMGAQNERPNKPDYDPEAYLDEDRGDHNPVQVSPFLIGKYPVTVQEFDAYFQDRDLEPPQGLQLEEQLEHPSRPMVRVTWEEARDYCRWRGGRLPAEEEWEYAARGAESRRYPWGDEAPSHQRANFNMNVKGLSPAGLFPAGATPGKTGEERVYDLAGNGWEWTSSNYNQSPDLRVVRGGSFDAVAWDLRAANRYGIEPGERFDFIGFRCVRDVPL